jgi:dolichol-phosphate mannosyltransferase
MIGSAWAPIAPAPAALPAVTPPVVSIVLPTYNEHERIAECIDAVMFVMAANGIDGEVIVVDDNSPDGTASIAESLTTPYPVRVIRRREKLGLGSAVRAGFAAAAGTVLGVMDADLSHPPTLLPRLLQALESGADFAVGSRYVPGGGTRDWPIGRWLLSRLACLTARPLTPVRDATSGVFLIRRDVLRGVPMSTRGFKIGLELLVRSKARVVVEVPYMFVGRSAGRSKLTVGEVFGYVYQLAELAHWQWHGRKVGLSSIGRFQEPGS